MPAPTPALLRDVLELADRLREGRPTMLEPQDLPGRYGRVVQAVDRLLALIDCPGVVGGGWAVWRHGYVGRVTQDLDIALPADRVEEFLRVASVSGFEVLAQPPGRWPKLVHKDTGVEVDVRPEGGWPGTPAALAPTTIPHPGAMDAGGPALRYMTLPALVQLELGAGRARDESDVVELIRANPKEVEGVRRHLASVHTDYVASFDALVHRAREQDAT
jgi:hypothetical protein